MLLRLAAAGLGLLLAACASTPPPDYPQDHPANPQAAAAPADEMPSALASYRAAGAPAAARPAGAAGEPDRPKSEKEDPHAGHRR